MRFLSNFGCKKIFMCSLNFWQLAFFLLIAAADRVLCHLVMFQLSFSIGCKK